MTFNPLVLTDAYISIDSNVIGENGNKLTGNFQIEDLDATTFGNGGAHARRGGLFDGSLDLTLFNNFDSGELDSIMWDLLMGRVPVDFEIRPTSGSVASSNPKYTGQLLVTKWSPITGDVGKLVQVDVSFPTSGIVSRTTS